MAKGTGAGVGTYGALTVANKDYKPIDYGQFAEGFADVAIETRKRKDETLDGLSEKYGEVFGTDQMEGVGLDNFDTLADGLQANLLTDFNAINEMVESGELRGPEARRRSSELKGQLMSFKQDYDKIASFVQEYNTKENKGAAMDAQMEKIQRFLDGAQIGKNKEGKYVLQKMVNGVAEEQSLDNMKDLLEVRDRVDISTDVAAPIFEIDSKANKAFKGNTAYNTFLDNDKQLTQAQSDVIEDFVRQRYDDKDLIDLADQYGVEVAITKNGVALADKEKAIETLMPQIKDSVRDQYELREYSEENQQMILQGRKFQYNSNMSYGNKEKIKYKIREFKDGSAVINTTSSLTVQSVAGFAIPENTDATEAEKYASGVNSPGGSPDTTAANRKYFDLSVNYVRISPSGDHLILNGNYTPEIEEAYVDNNGVTKKKKTRGPQERGDLMLAIDSIDAQNILDQMGVTDAHRNVFGANKTRVGRNMFKERRGRMGDWSPQLKD